MTMANSAASTPAHADHITPLAVYLTVGAALLVLTAVTVVVSKIPLGPWNAIVALAIASLKALLVALFFMHLLYDRKIYGIVVSLALVMLGILISLTMADVLRRGDIYDFEANPIRPEAKIYDPKTGLPLKAEQHSGSPTPANDQDTSAMSRERDARDAIDTSANPGGSDHDAAGKKPD